MERVHPLAAEIAPIADALGRVAAEPVVAEVAVPRFANSAMDGYALYSTDTDSAPVRLRVVGLALAGSPTDCDIAPGEAVRIMTGAPVPASADAVCVLERTHLEEGSEFVVIEAKVPRGANIRLPGDDISVGQEVVRTGTVISASHLGVLASLGRHRVSAYRVPRVGVLSSGDELAANDEPLRRGQIHDANRPTLMALCRQAGFKVVDLGMVHDDEEAIAGVLRAGEECCDAIVTTGGVSVGDADLLKIALDKLSGGAMASMTVAVKPGKPLAFGVLAESGVPVIGLSGNPAAAIVGFQLFARPALMKMAGRRDIDHPIVRGISEFALPRRRDGKLHVVRSTATIGTDGMTRVRPSGGQASHLVRSLAEANAFALVPDGEGVLQGGEVDAMLLEQAPAASLPDSIWGPIER